MPKILNSFIRDECFLEKIPVLPRQNENSSQREKFRPQSRRCNEILLNDERIFEDRSWKSALHALLVPGERRTNRLLVPWLLLEVAEMHPTGTLEVSKLTFDAGLRG